MRANWGGPPTSGQGGGVQLAMPELTPMVKRLIIGTSAVFLFHWLLSWGPPAAPRTFTHLFAISPDVWRLWFPLEPVWQLLTWGFLHSIHDPFHLLGNMLFLYFLGTMLEGIIGSRRFLVLYLSSLLVAGIATLILGLLTNASHPPLSWETLGTGSPPTSGASGAVLAVVVATAVMRPNTRVIFILFPITLKTLALFYVGFDVFYVLSELKGDTTSNVARTAHLVGAGWGFLVARRGWVWRDPLESLESWRAQRDGERRVRDDQRLDSLLAKINREGIHSLSAGEKAFLKRKSKRR